VPERVPAFFVVANTRVYGDPLTAGIDNAAMNFLEQVAFVSYERL
tara:strand:- start:282 stop:416 length:135 start_codon:yes stop_codon:yes gene_type:complete